MKSTVINGERVFLVASDTGQPFGTLYGAYTSPEAARDHDPLALRSVISGVYLTEDQRADAHENARIIREENDA